MEKTIYDLKLHESMEIINSGIFQYRVTRVPGGWLYNNRQMGEQITFVPFNVEFKEFEDIGFDNTSQPQRFIVEEFRVTC